jgi:ATP/maltotriose-dependent transcriptional regulator MalT
MRGHLSEGLAWSERVLRHSELLPVHLRASGQVNAGCLALHRGDYALAQTYFEKGLTLWEEVPDDVGILDPMLEFAVVAESQGDDARATRLYEAALTRARGRSDDVVVLALANLAYAAYRQRDLDRAAALADEALTHCPQQPSLQMAARCSAAQVAIERGEYERAAHLYADTLSMSRSLMYQLGIASALAGIAGVATATGQPTPAARLLGAVAAIKDRHHMAILAFDVQHERALAATRAALASEAFERATAHGREMPLDDVMTEALTICTSAIAPAAVGAPPATAGYGLTRRELEVLRLVVEGLSDREIAARLFISPHTVMRHVAGILGKLDLPSRTAAATWAMRHGLG